MLNKIITELNKLNPLSYENRIVMSEIFSVIETFELVMYEEDKYYKAFNCENIFFSYSTNPNNSCIEVVEILEDGRVFTFCLNISVEEFTPKNIFKKIKKYIDSSELFLLFERFKDVENIAKELVFVEQFIKLAKYEGEVKKTQKYKNKNEAINIIKKLYL